MIIDPVVLKKMSPFAEGGEGLIYDWHGQILKIYKFNVNFAEKQDKIKLLISKKLSSNIIAPLEEVCDNKGKFIGYLMNKIEGEPFKSLSSKKFVKANGITSKDVTYMLVQIRNFILELHGQSIVIGDLNDKNILFDKNFNIYLIDVDSWVIGPYKNDVCMDTFRDPLLISNDFNAQTDSYAFAIMIFKGLTRLHPFGGTMTPDMSILDRMKKGISVIGHPEVTVPQNINRWESINPQLIQELQEIYTNKKRQIITNSLDDLCSHLKPCGVHGDYYYSQYTDCPICNNKAKLVTKPVKVSGDNKTVTYSLLFGDSNVLFFIDMDSYISKNKKVVSRKHGVVCDFKQGIKFYVSDDNDVFKVSDRFIQINDFDQCIEKTNRSMVTMSGSKLYFINLNNELLELEVTDNGNAIKKIQQVAFNTIFEVKNSNQYLICNIYDSMKIINVDGYNYIWNNMDDIQEYGIHFDSISGNWLFIVENQKGEFKTLVFNKNKVVFESDQINYLTKLSNLCFYNSTIFIPGDKLIRGYGYQKNVYKDFEFDIVNDDSKLIKNDSKIYVINEQEIYVIG